MVSPVPNHAQNGNMRAAGNIGSAPRNPLTQQLIAQLHEIDRSSKKENHHAIVESLIKLAKGGTYKYKKLQKDKRGVMRMMWVEEWYPPDLNAIKEVFDRVQGKAPQQVNIDATVGQNREQESLDKLRRLLDLSEDEKVIEGTATESAGATES